MHLKYGLYSCRGTCQCGEWDYQAPGSFGYEKRDVQWMADAGADFLKIDSCCASQDHATAFQEYGTWRDAMNATGTARGAPIYFSICGCVVVGREWTKLSCAKQASCCTKCATRGPRVR